MSEEAPKKPDIVKIAKSRRHFKIVEALQQGKTLTQAEIRELAEYETGEEADTESPAIMATQKQIAKLFSVDTRTIRNWIDAGMPAGKRGKYDVAKIVAWKIMRDQPASPDAWMEKINEGRARLVNFRADIVEANARTVKGQLIAREDVERGLVQVSIAIKMALLALPRSIAPRLVGLEPREIEAVLRERVEEIINLFAKELIFEEPGKRGKKNNRKAKNMDR